MENNSSRAFIFAILGILIGAIGGFYIGQKYLTADLQKKTDRIEEARGKFPSVEDVRSVPGIVKKIEGNVLYVEAQLSLNPFEDLPPVRQIAVSKNTAIVRLVQKDAATYQKELAVFKPTGNSDQPPAPYIEVPTSFDQIKQGSWILAETTENVKNLERFDAAKIRVQDNLIAPANTN